MNSTELITTGIYAGLFLVLFAVGELLYHAFKMPVEITRKFVHIVTGFICLSFPFFISTHWSVLLLTVTFFVILTLSMKFDLLKSINAVDRKTKGSFLFPLVIYINFWAYSIFGLDNYTAIGISWEGPISLNGILNNQASAFYFLPLLILTISDPMAALFGKKWPVGKYKVFGGSKTLMGSGTFFLLAFVFSLIFSFSLSDTLGLALVIAISIALVTTIVEGISQKGIDNLLIPVSAILMLVIFNKYLL